MVPKGENDTQGGDTNKFFDANRVWRNPTGKAAEAKHRAGRPTAT
ncbi:hypothetical protein [Actinomadura macrotermitis]|uniref:Uncharacterized protein n=1 Tax=Actinomadura macrotermitis TaxID=2585200 RepID=A0A7K0BYJ6_9ACTN|nr:hypothetical protein [Actinomadura macrotermitis]MQY06257.1 hypothetical protein [Actinomadura macrotermitis]